MTTNKEQSINGVKETLLMIVGMRWAGHVACMGEERGCTGSCWETGGKDTTGET